MESSACQVKFPANDSVKYFSYFSQNYDLTLHASFGDDLQAMSVIFSVENVVSLSAEFLHI